MFILCPNPFTRPWSWETPTGRDKLKARAEKSATRTAFFSLLERQKCPHLWTETRRFCPFNRHRFSRSSTGCVEAREDTALLVVISVKSLLLLVTFYLVFYKEQRVRRRRRLPPSAAGRCFEFLNFCCCTQSMPAEWAQTPSGFVGQEKFNVHGCNDTSRDLCTIKMAFKLQLVKLIGTFLCMKGKNFVLYFTIYNTKILKTIITFFYGQTVKLCFWLNSKLCVLWWKKMSQHPADAFLRVQIRRWHAPLFLFWGRHFYRGVPVWRIRTGPNIPIRHCRRPIMQNIRAVMWLARARHSELCSRKSNLRGAHHRLVPEKSRVTPEHEREIPLFYDAPKSTPHPVCMMREREHVCRRPPSPSHTLYSSPHSHVRPVVCNAKNCARCAGNSSRRRVGRIHQGAESFCLRRTPGSF